MCASWFSHNLLALYKSETWGKYYLRYDKVEAGFILEIKF